MSNFNIQAKLEKIGIWIGGVLALFGISIMGASLAASTDFLTRVREAQGNVVPVDPVTGRHYAMLTRSEIQERQDSEKSRQMYWMLLGAAGLYTVHVLSLRQGRREVTHDTDRSSR